MAGWRCFACEAENPAGTRWCGACGEARPAGGDGGDLVWGCASCNAANPTGAAFCGHCGTRRATERPIEERREVTALFADISGFTTLADTLADEEALHAVIEPVISALAVIAERYGGTVAKYAGDALLVFFGAPVAHEDDAARALEVASAMHAALPDVLASLPEAAGDLELHIGVNTGRVVAGQFGGDVRSDYSILGDAVNVAQRLESVAPAGSTYVGDRTREQAAERFRFEWVGELQLKGKLRAIPAWRLVGARHGGAGGGARGPFVGRDGELAAVTRALSEVARGRGGGFVSLVGEAGMGKTRLLTEVRARSEGAGARWLQVRCPSYGAELAYWPFAELARAVLGVRVDHDAATARALIAGGPGVDRRLLPLLARLLGCETAADGPAGADPEEARAALHRGVVAWLLRLAEQRPTVVAVEDVHWIDRSSQALATELARATQGWPLALVVTGRPEAEPTVAAIGAGVDATWRVRAALGPLDARGVQELLAALLGGEPPPEVVRAAVDRSAGNPLFCTELVRALLDERALVRAGSTWRMRTGWSPSGVPETVERLLSSRIDLLDPEPATVLSAAAVVGRLVRLPILRAVAVDPDLDRHLDALVDAGFLDPTSDSEETAFAFRHALVQEVAYGRLLRRRRTELHRRVAEVAEDLYGDGDDVVELLARHSYLGQRGPVAVDHCARAGRRAAALFANDEAVGHLRRAVELAGDGAAADDVRLALADLLALVGDYDEALAVYRSLHERTTQSIVGEADVLRKVGAYAEAEALLEAGIAAAGGETPHAARLWHRLGWTRAVHGSDGATSALQTAVRLAGDDLRTMAAALVVLVRSCLDDKRVDDAVQYGTFARLLHERLGDVRGLGAALRALGDALGASGRLDEAAAVLQRALELARRTGDVEEAAGTLINLGVLEAARGDAAAAAACDRRAVAEFERIGHGAGTAIAYGNLADKLVQLGELDEAERCCARALEHAAAIGHGLCTADVTLTLARLREARGDLVEAVILADDAARRFRGLDAPAMAEQAAAEAVRLRALQLSPTPASG